MIGEGGIRPGLRTQLAQLTSFTAQLLTSAQVSDSSCYRLLPVVSGHFDARQAQIKHKSRYLETPRGLPVIVLLCLRGSGAHRPAARSYI